MFLGAWVKFRFDSDAEFITYLSSTLDLLFKTRVNNVSIENISVESRKELGQMVTDEVEQIEKGLSVVCNQVPINDQTTLDILCHDSDGQLVVLQMAVEEDDNMLLQGIESLDYVERFKSFLKATYSKHKIDEKEKPRLILVAPSFSETLHHTVEYMQGIHINLYEWEYLKIGDHKGLRLQPLFASKPSKKTKEEKKTKKSTKKKHQEKKKEKPEEKKEESKPEPKPEPPKEEIPKFPRLPENSEQEKEKPKEDKKKHPQKRKLKLF